ncbi:MAG TPA: flagellar biosynthesis protein FlgB [Acidisphaera sp.]|nr:flagellar biosynthesis protein FlgB [Acidisphaera sp.]
MNLFQTGVFDLAQRRLDWAERRQTLLAQNIANADTPNYRPSDLPAFAKTLADNGVGTATQMVQTQPMHMAGTFGPLQPDPNALPDAREPDGNAVSMDKELGKVADTQTAQTLALNLYGKYASFFRLALGRTS